MKNHEVLYEKLINTLETITQYSVVEYLNQLYRHHSTFNIEKTFLPDLENMFSVYSFRSTGVGQFAELFEL